jgi:hypothetical protein
VRPRFAKSASRKSRRLRGARLPSSQTRSNSLKAQANRTGGHPRCQGSSSYRTLPTHSWKGAPS